MRRRDFALTLPLALSACAKKGGEKTGPSSHPRRAVEYLLSKQAADGGWHSETYGLLRSGQSLTPFVLLALVEAKGAEVPREAVDRGLTFISDRVDSDGCLGRRDAAGAAVDYPNYATGLALRVAATVRRPGWEQMARPMISFLRSQQFAEHNGWTKSHAPYGGWGIGGGVRTPPHAGHVDLSMTRHVLEGLAAAGVAAGDPVFEKAAVFVGRCQNFGATKASSGDGGFFFSTVVLDANKAGDRGNSGGFNSYGTMTADGVLSWLAMGVGTGDARVRAGVEWLQRNHRADGAPGGFEGVPLQVWTRGLRFYYASAYADVRARLGAGAGFDLGRLAADQRPDGSWANPEPLVKEDDPLIATPFALRALMSAAG